MKTIGNYRYEILSKGPYFYKGLIWRVSDGILAYTTFANMYRHRAVEMCEEIIDELNLPEDGPFEE